MEIRQVSDNIAIYSDGQRLQVIHDLGDEFVLDLALGKDYAWNIDRQAQETIQTVEPVFKVCALLHCRSSYRQCSTTKQAKTAYYHLSSGQRWRSDDRESY